MRVQGSEAAPLSQVDLIPIAITDACLVQIEPAADERGSLAEMLRFSWVEPVEFVQWNLVRSGPRVLRGMHWHNHHHDFILPVAGELVIALTDLRRGSPTEGAALVLTLRADRPVGALVPPGVAHGFYSEHESTAIYATSRYWDPDDELGVAFDDPELGVRWPVRRDEVVLSDRDRGLPPLSLAGALPSYA